MHLQELVSLWQDLEVFSILVLTDPASDALVDDQLEDRTLSLLLVEPQPPPDVLEPDGPIRAQHDGQLLFLHIEQQPLLDTQVLLALRPEVQILIIALELLNIMALVCIDEGDELMHFLLVLEGDGGIMVEGVVFALLAE